MESGTMFNPWAMIEDPLRSAKAVAKNINCPSDSSKEFLKCIKSKPMEEVFKAYLDYAMFPESFPIYFGPVVESKNGDKNFLNEHPTVLLKEKRFNDVPVIIGFNKNEGDMMTVVSSGGFNDFDKDFFENRFEEFVTRMTDFKHPEMPQVCNLLKKKYFADVTDWNDKSQTRTPLNMITGDSLFSSGAIRLANHLAHHGNEDAYIYHFSYNGKSLISAVLPDVTEHALTKDKGPTHADELQYLFDSTVLFGALEGKDLEVSKQLVTLWTNFAKTGKPTTKSSDSLPEWKPITKDVNNYLDIGDTFEMKTDYEPERMKLWNSILPKLESGEKIFKDEL